MRIGYVFAFLLLFCSLSSAEDRRYWRVKVTNANSGELITWPKNACGQAIADNVWRIVKKKPYMEVVDNTFSARIDEPKPVLAPRSLLEGDEYTGFYDPNDTRTIVFTIRWKLAKDNHVPVAISVIDRTNQCHETWVGEGVRI